MRETIEIKKIDDLNIRMHRDDFWKKEENVTSISKAWNLIVRDSEKAKKEGILSLEEDFEDFHSGFYGNGVRRIVDNLFNYDLAKEIVEEKNKDSQFLNYFYFVAWNTIRYGGDIYQNLRNFFPDSYSLRV